MQVYINSELRLWALLTETTVSVVIGLQKLTHHINEVHQFFKVWVNFEVVDLFRFQLLSCTFHPHQGSSNLKELHTLQVPQSPK